MCQAWLKVLGHSGDKNIYIPRSHGVYNLLGVEGGGVRMIIINIYISLVKFLYAYMYILVKCIVCVCVIRQ